MCSHVFSLYFVSNYLQASKALVFLDELGKLLSVICTDFDCLIVLGDFNLHVDNPENSYAKELNALLDTFILTQPVQGPTHSLGHTMDLVILTLSQRVSVSLQLSKIR